MAKSLAARSEAAQADERSAPPPPRPADLAQEADDPVSQVSGDVDALGTNARVVLIVEDDATFAVTLVELARQAGFKAVVAATGRAALELVRRHPVTAVLLDIKLPDLSGYAVLERLKRSSDTRHVPVHIVSGVEQAANALSLGAIGHLVKPARKDQLTDVFAKIEQVLTTKVKRVLLVEDDQIQREAIRQLLGNGDLKLDMAGSAADALRMLQSTAYQCMILDLRLPDMTGFDLLERLDAAKVKARPPVVVYTGKDLTRAEQERLERYAESIIIKGARSPERLLDEVSLFLHRVEAHLPEDSQAMLRRLRSADETLRGRRVLVVDDDMRNVFALVNALDSYGIETLVARSGQDALDRLAADGGIELVLMDIMMPGMDGYEAMRRIRRNQSLKKLPVIALTAKAMREDQERCLAAGANDYMPKPVQIERLVSLLKVWLPGRA
jgi:CheY-like chemotaxis protein